MERTDTPHLTIDDLLRAESEVLDRIAREIESETSGASGGVAGHTSHTSGHSSSGGHNSTVARVESVKPDET